MNENKLATLLEDYIDNGNAMQSIRLQELQNEAEARALLLKQLSDMLLKYPCEIMTSSGQNKICHML